MNKSIGQQIDELNRRVMQLYQRWQYEEAVEVAKESTALAQEHLGEDHPSYATSLNNLAGLYKSMGHYGEAEPLYRHATAIKRAALGEDHPSYATSLNNLAELYRSTGRYGEAEPLYRQAMAILRVALGEDHPNYATCLKNLAALYAAMGRYDEAEPLLQQAVEGHRLVLGERHPNYATSLNDLAVLYRAMGRYGEAEPLMQQATDIRRLALGEDHPSYAASLNNLAALYAAMGRYGEAEPLYRQATAIERAALGEDHPSYATSLNNLAELYRSMGRYGEAEPLLQQATEARRVALGEDHPDYAQSLTNLGVLYETTGRFDEAKPLMQRATEIWRRVLGKDHPEYATSLMGLAELYKAMGRYDEAEPHIQRATEIVRAALGENHPLYATSLMGLAGLHEEMGRFDEAKPLMQQATEIRRVALGEDHPDYAASLTSLAVLYEAMGRFDEAKPLMQQATEIRRVALGEDHPDYAASLNNLAMLYLSEGRYSKAEQLMQQGVEGFRAGLGEKHPNYATSLNNLASLYQTMGRFDEAKPLMQRATEVKRVTLGEDHPDFAWSLNNLAALYAATNQVSKALPLMEQALTIHDQLIGQVFSISSEKQRTAFLYTLQGIYYLFLSLISQYLSDTPAAVHAAFSIVLRRKALGAEALAAQRDALLGGRYPHLALQLQRLNTLRAQIAQKRLAGPGDEDPGSYRQTLAAWEAEKEHLEAELARQIPEVNLELQLQAADRAAVAGRLPTGAALVEFVRFPVFDFHAVPARGEPQRKPARYVAFVLPAGRLDAVEMIDLGEAEPIDHLIAAFRARIITGNGAARDFTPEATRAERVSAPTSGHDLRALVFDPLREALGGATRLLLSPDGDLARLPFEVLPEGEGATDGTAYLTDAYRISYVATGRDVLRFGATTDRPTATPIVAADPDFDLGGNGALRDTAPASRHSRDLDRASLRFGRLPGTRLEGERVAALLDTQPWLEGEALEARFRTTRSPEVLHLATHGFFLEDQPQDPNEGPRGFGLIGVGEEAFGEDRGRMLGRGIENPLLRSGLALAGVNTWLRRGTPPEAAEDGLLTAEDVTGLDLLDTELVVLSACETGLGEVQVGEGVLGLRRAFVLAGAKTLVMSLWKVPDLATAVLMVRFYENLLERGMERDAALRSAQRYLREVTVGDLREAWLSAAVIERLAAGRTEAREALTELAAEADEHRPFAHPLYWGAFICQGDTAPLRTGPAPQRSDGKESMPFVSPESSVLLPMEEREVE